MVIYIKTIFFGLIQGATEFLPVSSSGHLLILHELLPLPINNELAFDVVLHLATLLALLIFFRQEIINLLLAWLGSFSGQKSNDGRLAWLIILATIPALIVGYLFSDLIENKLHSVAIVSAMLIFVGIIFIICEKIFFKNTGNIYALNWQKSLGVGLAQILAFIPGTSRSGITIIAGLVSGLKRETAVKFSFLLSIPTIAAAGLSQINALFSDNLSNNEIMIYIFSFISAFFSAFLAIKYFLKFSQNHSLIPFAIYRFILAGVIIIYFFF